MSTVELMGPTLIWSLTGIFVCVLYIFMRCGMIELVSDILDGIIDGLT